MKHNKANTRRPLFGASDDMPLAGLVTEAARGPPGNAASSSESNSVVPRGIRVNRQAKLGRR